MTRKWMKRAQLLDARSRRGRPPRLSPALLFLALLAGGLGLAPDIASGRICTDCDPGDGGGGGDDGGGGGPDVPPPAPVAYVKDRSVSSITIGWFAALDAPNIVETLDGARWVEAFRINPGQAPEFQHMFLGADTRHCYRVKALGKTSDAVCAYTKDGILALRMIWRVQLQLTTGDVAGAGTDDPVAVGLAGPINGATGNATFLDHDRDDFGPSDVHNYDLVDLVGVSDLGDIESIDIYKQGTDDWCLRGVRLIVNESQVFEKTFGPPCRWVTNRPDGLVQIGHDELHSAPGWRSYRSPILLWPNLAVVVIPEDQIAGQIETRVGDALRRSNQDWDEDGNGAEVTQLSSSRAHVHFDVGGPANATMDVDFDLVLGTHRNSTGRWSVDVTTENANANVEPGWMWPFVILSGWNEVRGPEQQAVAAIETLALEAGIGNFWNVAARFDAYGNLIINTTLFCPGYPNCTPDPVSGLVARDVTYGMADPSATWLPSNGATSYRVSAAGTEQIVTGTSASWAAPNAVGTFTVQVTPRYDKPDHTFIEGQPASAPYKVRFNSIDCLPGRPPGCIPK